MKDILTHNYSVHTYLQGANYDFSAKPDLIRTLVEAERLSYGYLFNPSFGTEISKIEPLPHQSIAVYDVMLKQPRLRFLLADDAGAGKTIMAGLYIREMLSRRLIKRILIVPPAGLIGNWERELRTLFSLQFNIIRGADSKNTNPFIGNNSNLAIISIDTLRGEKTFARLKETNVRPYDLVIFDEAHKLGASKEPDGKVKRTDKYKVAEAIAGIPSNNYKWQLPWKTNHLLLLTATPHMGKPYPYYALWRLLEPNILSTEQAFLQFPESEKQKHFIRRIKEEMVNYAGEKIYPPRKALTFHFNLTEGEFSERAIYEKTSIYIRNFYNKAKLLNKAAARFVICVFQRRMTSSIHSLECSLIKRKEKLNHTIEDISSNRISIGEIKKKQEDLKPKDTLFSKTAEEETLDIDEVMEEEKELLGFIQGNISDIKAEIEIINDILHTITIVKKTGDESKFNKLWETLKDEKYKNEKVLIFTEYKDTLEYLKAKFEEKGFAGRIATISGGMDFTERDEQVDFFRKPNVEGGAQYLIGTDAAGEGLNMQFCWIMVNYDIPWNPARLEQRMGRIHRFKQTRSVVILNLVSSDTREGKVLETLLNKIDSIREQMQSEKVFDIIGKLFYQESIREIIENYLLEEGKPEQSLFNPAHKLETEISKLLSKDSVETYVREETRIYGKAEDVLDRIPALLEKNKKEQYHRLLPGYIYSFLNQALPFLGMELYETKKDIFEIRTTGKSLDSALWDFLQIKSQGRKFCFVRQPEDTINWLHPGQELYDMICEHLQTRYASELEKGAYFIDPLDNEPYIFYFIKSKIIRAATSDSPYLQEKEILEESLSAFKYYANGTIKEIEMEHLLFLIPGRLPIPSDGIAFAANIQSYSGKFMYWMNNVHLKQTVEKYQKEKLEKLLELEKLIQTGYEYQQLSYTQDRKLIKDRIKSGDVEAEQILDIIKEQNKYIEFETNENLRALKLEPSLIESDSLEFITACLVLPSKDEEIQKRHDKEIEKIAVQVAMSYEEKNGGNVRDVSNAALAIQEGLDKWPGFDLLSTYPEGEERNIEVKGRAAEGEIEISENEWIQSIQRKDKYWLYVVYNCASPNPVLRRIQNPYQNLLANKKGGVIINKDQILQFKAVQ